MPVFFGGVVDKTAATKVVKSCARTAADEEFLMVRIVELHILASLTMNSI
jgi:hypothetical protein